MFKPGFEALGVEDVIGIALQLDHFIVILEVLMADHTEGVTLRLVNRRGNVGKGARLKVTHGTLSLISPVLPHLLLHNLVLGERILVILHVGELLTSGHPEANPLREAACDANANWKGTDVRACIKEAHHDINVRYGDKGRNSSNCWYLLKNFCILTIESYCAPNSQPCHDEVVQTCAEVVNHRHYDKSIAATAPAPQEHVQRDQKVAENDVNPVRLDEYASIVKILAIHNEELPIRGKNGHCAKTAHQDGDKMNRERIFAQLRLDIVE